MEFVFTGTTHYTGVTFFIEAESIEEAKEKAEKGLHDEMEHNGSELYDWEIIPGTAKENIKETSC